MANDGTVKIGTELDDSGFRTGLSKLGNVASGALKTTIAGVGAASAAIGVLTSKSLDAYANYEQLVGGVDKLFGDASGKLQEYAANAYKTSGMSANQYMEQATSFSASLISALGGDTEQAADLANTAMVAMSDNVNVFGSNMEDVQHAFQGFAKQNYTMLDNLKLGYGGTKEEMSRLISDAAKLKDVQEELGLTVDENSMSFDNIIKAIQVTQANMGIMGTTSKEAASTIEGSLTMVKASWENLATGIADENADIDKLIEEFIQSVNTAADNVLPRIEKILGGIGTAVEKLAPILAEAIPELLESVLPSLISAAGDLISGLAEALPDLISTLVPVIIEFFADNVDDFIDIGVEILLAIVDGIADNVDLIIKAIPKIISAITNGISKHGSELMRAGRKIIESIADGLVDVAPFMKPVSDGIKFIMDNFDKLIPIVVTATTAMLEYKAAMMITDTIHKVTDAISTFGSVLSASPILATVGILTALTTGIVAYAEATKKSYEPTQHLTDAELELLDAANEAAEAFQNQQKATEDTMNGIDAQMTYVGKLSDELQTLADSSGKVQEKDQARAEFILGQLNEALGTEYKMVDGVIQQYDTLTQSIEDVIAMKTANALLEAGNADYVTALQEEGDAYEAVKLAQKDYEAQIEEVNKKYEEYVAKKKELEADLEAAIAAGDDRERIRLENDINVKWSAYQNEIDILNQKKADLDKYEENYKNYQNTILSYEDAQVAVLEGNAEKAKEILLNKSDDYRDWAGTVDLETSKVLNTLANEAEKAGKKAEEFRENFENGVEGYTEEMVEEAEEGYRQAMDAFGEAYDDAFGAGSDAGQGLIDGLLSKQPSLVTASSNMIKNGMLKPQRVALDSHSPSKKTKEIAHDAGDGTIIGIQDKTPGIAKAAREQTTKMLEALKIKNPISLISRAIPTAAMSVSAANAAMAPVSGTIEHTYSMAAAQSASNQGMIAELQAIRTAIQEGKILMVDRQVLAKVTNTTTRNNNRALGVGAY